MLKSLSSAQEHPVSILWAVFFVIGGLLYDMYEMGVGILWQRFMQSADIRGGPEQQ